MINKTTEDYLKQIFWLSRKSGKITTSAIAKSLAISSASVTDMVKKLFENGYLTYEPYYGVQLTRKGEKSALRVIRRHRLLELFLVKALEFSWDNVHEEAERLEHFMSEALEEKVDRYLGYPKYDPHGDPIPTHDGVMEEQRDCRLSELKEGESAVILRVTDSKKLLQYVKKMELALHSRVTVKSKESFDDSMTIRINGKKEQFLSREVTGSIFVKRIGKAFEGKQPEK
jgi:DtxR family Mn-dependent transcriptional regulator